MGCADERIEAYYRRIPVDKGAWLVDDLLKRSCYSAEAARLNHAYLENQLFSTAIQRGKDSIWRRGVPNSGGHYLARASEEHSGPHKRRACHGRCRRVEALQHRSS